jgi:transcriptional regulator with XRE-family HTH domain
MFVKVNQDFLKWLRKSSGRKIEEVSRRQGTISEIILEFESGKKSSKFSQLRILSELYKRPLASFFLSKSKEEKLMGEKIRISFVCQKYRLESINIMEMFRIEGWKF